MFDLEMDGHYKRSTHCRKMWQTDASRCSEWSVTHSHLWCYTLPSLKMTLINFTYFVRSFPHTWPDPSSITLPPCLTSKGWIALHTAAGGYFMHFSGNSLTYSKGKLLSFKIAVTEKNGHPKYLELEFTARTLDTWKNKTELCWNKTYFSTQVIKRCVFIWAMCTSHIFRDTFNALLESQLDQSIS